MFNNNIYMVQIDIVYHKLLFGVLAGIDFGFVGNLQT